MNNKLPRLDVLLYAHDGRGLGHASRSIGIGMALRRCYPELKVLFVSGCAMSGELIGSAPVDWMKLPSYRTEVVDGKSRGIDGMSGFGDRELGRYRSAQLRDIVRLYRPRVVVCDHSPQGKHRELREALEESKVNDTAWLLGMRGVVGAVPQAASELGRELFREHFQGILWYGDSAVLGEEHIDQLASFYKNIPIECGYVSRLEELKHLDPGVVHTPERYSCTMSIPWLGEKTLPLLKMLAEVIEELGPESGEWRLFVDEQGQDGAPPDVLEQFTSLDHVRVEPPSGRAYVEALLSSGSAVIFGGYNSVADVLSCNIPALAVLREMKDNEQQVHLQRLSRFLGDRLETVTESIRDSRLLKEKMKGMLGRSKRRIGAAVNIQGAENAAFYISQMIRDLGKQQ